MLEFTTHLRHVDILFMATLLPAGPAFHRINILQYDI